GFRSRSRHLGPERLDAAALRLDLRPRRFAHAVGADGERVGDLALAQDFDARALARLDQACADETIGIDDGIGREAAQRLEVHDGVVDAAATVGDEAALRQAAVERHLAALEAAGLAASRAGLVALVPLGRGFSMARSGAAADLLAPLRGARRRAQLVKLHGSPGARAAPWRSYRVPTRNPRESPTGGCGGARAPSPSPPAWGTGR